MKEDVSQFSFIPTNEHMENMRESFTYWHNKYTDSMINYSLVWKKALESDSEILKKIKEYQNNSEQNTTAMIEQFFEMWSHGIRETSFEMALKSTQNWKEFWKNLTGEQFKICNEVLQMMEKYWRNIQSKNIE